MPIKCNVCGFEIKECIEWFDIRNMMMNPERLHLIQCDNCRVFSLSAQAVSYSKEKWFHFGPYSHDQGKLIFMLFRACNGWFKCGCRIHQIVTDWQTPPVDDEVFFKRTDILEMLQADPRYPEWLREWEKLVLPSKVEFLDHHRTPPLIDPEKLAPELKVLLGVERVLWDGRIGRLILKDGQLCTEELTPDGWRPGLSLGLILAAKDRHRSSHP